MGIFIDPAELPPGSSGLVQVLFLGAAYGYVLFTASNMISDGSELLLLVPALAGIVGSIVLPVLGAVPDGAIVLFSGMGPNAQEQVSVGVGALAGSTIMLLTIPWALSVMAGRVNLNADGSGTYSRPRGAKGDWKKLSPPGNASLLHTGVVLFAEIPSNAKTMMLTGLIYLIVQIPALRYTGTKDMDDRVKDPTEASAAERPFALAATIICMLAFVGYLVWNAHRASKVAVDVVVEKQIQAIKSGQMSLTAVLGAELEAIKKRNAASESTDLEMTHTAQVKSVADVIRPFFKIYDQNNDNTVDADELMMFFKDMGEPVTRHECVEWIQAADTDGNGSIDFHELVESTYKYLLAKYEAELNGTSVSMKTVHGREASAKRTASVQVVAASHEGGEDDDEEDEEVPEDLAHLPVAEQQRRIKIRACKMMFLGTALVLLFSDPMVEVLSEIGSRTGIPAFYVSFIVAPLASNASELIAAYNYAQKKTSKTISISISALLGAACMNNTFCLGIFAALLFFKEGLIWEFTAETIAILFVEFAVGLMALKKTQRLGDAILVFLLYPLSIALVYVLENVAGLD